MLGNLKAAGILPLDPTYPAARLEFLPADAKPTALLTIGSLRDASSRQTLRRVYRFCCWRRLAARGGTHQQRPRHGSLGRYPVTSGSTGRPKSRDPAPRRGSFVAGPIC